MTEGGDVVYIGADPIHGEEVRVLRNRGFLDIGGGDLRPERLGSAPGFGSVLERGGGLVVDGNDAWFAANGGVHGIALYLLTVPLLPTQIFTDDFED